ncbi:hypothetical protein AgCh_021309 [Apium graveolens]
MKRKAASMWQAITSKKEEGFSHLDQPEQTMALVKIMGVYRTLEQNPDATAGGNAEPWRVNDQNDVLLAAGMEDSRGADVNLDVPAIYPDGSNLEITSIIHPLAILPSQPPVGAVPNRQRKPCYGWLSDEDEDSDDIVYVPAKLPEKTKWNKMGCSTR